MKKTVLVTIAILIMLAACAQMAHQAAVPNLEVTVPENVEPWPDPEYMHDVPRIVRWHDMYAQMEMSPEWAAAKPVSETGWETPGLLDSFLAGPMKNVEEVVYAVRQGGHDWHWYANFGYRAGDANSWLIGQGGRLVRHNLRTGEEFTILDAPGGDIRDPYVDYDGKTILFSYRPREQKNYHLYTIQSDGTGLTQLTDDPYDDIEAIIMANGDIMFCSTRSRRWVPCFHTQVATLYRCDPDGKNIRCVSMNVETDNTPWMMPDGTVLYTRWEYVERDQNLSFHHLWTFRPDGTNVMTYFGNLFAGMLLIDAKPIPGSDKVVCTAAPGHGRSQHHGAVTLIDPNLGPDALEACQVVSRPEEERPPYSNHKDPQRWRDPWAFSEDCFLVARERSLCVMDGQGRYETLATLDETIWPIQGGNRQYMIHEPRPLIPREREPILPDLVDWKQDSGYMALNNVYIGRKMDGVEPGDIKKLMLLEVLPKPINFFGGADQNGMWPTYFIYRVLGTVPVEEDGSAYFEVPALRPIFFVALDENDMSVKRMQSFTGAMPGEKIGCVGCHERRTESAIPPMSPALMAMKGGPDKIEPIAGTPEIFHFPRDIQPVFDKHCISCHNYEKYAGKITLTGERGLSYANSYANLYDHKQIKNADPVGNHPPRALGSSASPVIQKFAGGHHGVKASPSELKLLKTWIDAGANYSGTYGSLASGMIFFKDPPEDMIERRCAECHPGFKDRKGRVKLHDSLRDDTHFNLKDPEKSLMLLAPLSKEAGGLGLCRQRKFGDKPKEDEAEAPVANVFTSTDDADYQIMLAKMRDIKDWLINDVKSVEFDTFVPNDAYIREMKNYGILDQDFDPETDPIDTFKWDQQYWQLFWHQPEK